VTQAEKRRDILMLPGPTDIPLEAYEAMSQPLINHRGQRFREFHVALIEKLKKVIGTKQDVFLLTCSGTGGVEAALSNTIRSGDKVLALVGGQFGERMAEAARYYSDNVVVAEVPWRRAPTVEDVRRGIQENGDVDVVLLVHNETSTGGLAPNVEEIARECRRADALLVLDAVTSLGGVPLKFDDAGIDLLLAGTQKCLAGPPGLSLVAVSERAWEKIESLKKRPAYFDLVAHREFMSRGETPFTPAISLFYGLNSSLDKLLEIGVENWIDRHRRGAQAFYKSLSELELEIYPLPPYRSPTLIAVQLPDHIRDADVAKKMAEKHGVHVGVGVSKLKGRIIRIGSMGQVTAERTKTTMKALCNVLSEYGMKLDYEAVDGIIDESFSR